jgi:hypothetical protein
MMRELGITCDKMRSKICADLTEGDAKFQIRNFYPVIVMMAVTNAGLGVSARNCVRWNVIAVHSAWKNK